MSRDLREQALALREELLARRAGDPWWNWAPHPKQETFVKSILAGEVTEAWAICANRSGKSDAAAYIAAALARFGRANPKYGSGRGDFAPTKGWVISATTNASKSVIQPKLFDNGLAAAESHQPFIPTREILGFNQNDQVLKLKNGSIVEFKTAEAKTLSFAGAGLDWVLIDEELPKPLYDEIAIRIGAGKSLLIFGACTLLPPEGQVGGVSWMFGHMIKPWLANPRACSYRLFGWSIYDNPHLMPDEIRRLESKYPVGSAERSIRLDGEWLPGIQGARAYTSFDRRTHVVAQPPLNPRRPILWTWDFNVEPMASLICQREDTLFRCHRELVLETDASIEAMVQWFYETIPSHQSEVWIYGDATARKRNVMAPGGKTEYQVILNLMRTYGCPIRLKVPESNPQVPDRINAVNVAFRDAEGISHVEIDPSCVELIADFEDVLRDNRGGIKKVNDRHNPYFKRTHPSDAWGYLINYEMPVRSARQKGTRGSAIAQPRYGSGG
jgi:hypothetical protein